MRTRPTSAHRARSLTENRADHPRREPTPAPKQRAGSERRLTRGSRLRDAGAMKRPLALVVATSAAVAAFALPSGAAARTVSVKDNFFSPASITVSRGTTITWAWRGINLHNVHK